jgi:hypothetical protein
MIIINHNKVVRRRSGRKRMHDVAKVILLVCESDREHEKNHLFPKLLARFFGFI